MKPRNANTGHADGLFSLVCKFGFNSPCAAANASLKAVDEGSNFDMRSQYKILWVDKANENTFELRSKYSPRS